MSKEETINNRNVYYNVIEGTFRTRVEKDHPEAVAREYETKDGAKSVKYERRVGALSGLIEDIIIYDGDYGKTINIRLDANPEGKNPIIQLNAATTYGEDFLKKAPNIDFHKEVKMAPFAFTSEDTGREIRGINITQDKQKIKNFFYDTEAKKAINGYPTPEGDVDEYTKEDWKIFYLQARKFLMNYLTEKVIPKIPKLRDTNFDETENAEFEEERVDSEIPF